MKPDPVPAEAVQRYEPRVSFINEGIVEFDTCPDGEWCRFSHAALSQARAVEKALDEYRCDLTDALRRRVAELQPLIDGGWTIDSVIALTAHAAELREKADAFDAIAPHIGMLQELLTERQDFARRFTPPDKGVNQQCEALLRVLSAVRAAKGTT